MKGHSKPVRAISWSSAKNLLATGSDDGRIMIYDSIYFNVHSSLSPSKKSWILSLDFNSEGTHIVSGSSDFIVRIWSLNSRQCVHTLSDHQDQVWCTVFSSIRDHLFTASDDKSICVYSVRDLNF